MSRHDVALPPNRRWLVRHIPGPDGRTYCGRSLYRHVPSAGCACGRTIRNRVACINVPQSPEYDKRKPEDCVDDAECKSCQSSDDRRVREEYRKTDEYKRQEREERGR
jgi:hypothetical protein